MNENVTNKTPKRRRWIARLLVSALCILLASSLLFVGVVADNIELVAQFSANYGLAVTPAFVYPFSDYIAYTSDYFVYLNSGSTVTSAFDIRGCSSYNTSYTALPKAFYWDGTVLYSFGIDSRKESNSTYYFTLALYSLSLVSGEIVSGEVEYFPISSSYTTDPFNLDGSFSVIDGDVYGCFSYNTSSTTTSRRTVPFKIVDSILSVSSYNTSFVKGDGKLFSFVSGSFMVVSCANNVSNWVLLYSIFDLSPPNRLSFYGSSFSYENDFYLVNSESLLLWDESTNTFLSVGNGISGLTFYAKNGVLYSYMVPSSLSVSYTVYTGLPTTEPPLESSDETTTEPPPESSEGSSVDPSAETKIWGSILNADGSYTSSLLGSLDLSEATEVRVYIGSWTSKDSPFQSETPVPLTFYVYNSEDEPPEIYTFDYHAAGYSLSGDSVSDFTFPDVIGQFFTLPYNGETDLYFPNVAPYGTVLVSTPFGDSFGGRVMLNLVSADSYFRLDFVDEDTFAVVLFNDAGPGSRTNFDLDIRAYREGYRLEDGETSSSRWFYPSFGSSASYTAEYVTESGLYLIFVDSVEDTVYPWEDGTWSDAIGDANSRIEDISANHALLESLANDAYGKYSFDPMTNQNFIGAVSEFNDIRESSGGNYILRYIWGMWNIHPFASSMIAIVGTLAIVGFIIRKM